jgi:hypothetical protein
MQIYGLWKSWLEMKKKIKSIFTLSGCFKEDNSSGNMAWFIAN